MEIMLGSAKVKECSICVLEKYTSQIDALFVYKAEFIDTHHWLF